MLKQESLSGESICLRLQRRRLCDLGSVHTGTTSYRSTSVRSKKWYGERLHSHGTEKSQAVHSKTGPEIGQHGKVNQKLEIYDIVPFRSRVISYRFPDLFSIYRPGDTKLVSMTTSDVEVEITPNCTTDCFVFSKQTFDLHRRFILILIN